MSIRARIRLFLLGAIGITLMVITNDFGTLVARERVIIYSCALLIVFSLISKPIVKGKVMSVDLIRVNGYRDNYESTITLNQEYVENICNILSSKTACLYFSDEFLYKYALRIYTDKKRLFYLY